MTADCWRCGLSVDLTEEQEQQVLELLAEAGSAAASSHPASLTEALPRAEAPAQEPEENTAEPAASNSPAPVPLRASLPRSASRWLRDLPAWLISLVLHLLLLTVLALWTLGGDPRPSITLSTRIAHDFDEGEHPIELAEEPSRFDLPIPEDVDLTSPRERKALEQADQDARELRVDPDVVDPQLPDVEDTRRRIGDTTDIRAALAARDPRVRVEMVRREGGTTLTEAAVARGLRWLARQQRDDGSWQLRGYDRSRTGVESRTAATSMALLAYLGAGQTHLSGRYQGAVGRGLRWLIEHQDEEGGLLADSDRQAGMYAHGQAAIALCEAFAMTGDEQLRSPAQKALRFIEASQYSDGGWRYTPSEPRSPPGGDTSVVGWQLMALQSGRMAGLEVSDFTLELSGHFLDRVQSFDGSRYGYRADHAQPTPAMTAEALLCRIYLGWNRDDPALRRGVRYLIDEHLPTRRNVNIYYWYYGSQVLHHVGGDDWKTWNTRMRDLLVELQEDSGRHAGSWPPEGAYASAGGRLYVTCLSICTLEVYYRHLPLFRLGSSDHAF